ncbi:MAG: hypothetical protein FJZ59_01330 [Chlamydiae bacterium]|nr:hypothetical protein [Chlamydiota bacterium]
MKSVWTLLMVPCALMSAHSEMIERAKCNEVDFFYIEDLQKNPYENLPSDQIQVYHQLGPLYQKIYLYALNDEERHRVVVYVRRGVSCFEAINIILRREERKFHGTPNLEENRPVKPTERFQTYKENSQEIY